jgi:predicted transcriptional regulator
MDEIVYQLIIEDVQKVALQEIERKLTKSEIQKIQNSIAENIDWYNAIAHSIEQKLEDEFHRSN